MDGKLLFKHIHLCGTTFHIFIFGKYIFKIDENAQTKERFTTGYVLSKALHSTRVSGSSGVPLFFDIIGSQAGVRVLNNRVN